MVKLIKSEADYASALAEISELMDRNPQPGTPEADKLEVLGVLVQEYEFKAFPVESPDPIDALQFRMEQQDLTPRDLIPFIGSRSKVSEVLSRKRPLTMSMVRALHQGLKIPAKVLIQQGEVEQADGEELDWSNFPLREMASRGWIENTITSAREFFLNLPAQAGPAVLYRKSDHIRSARKMDNYALMAWSTRLISRSQEYPLSGAYRPGSVTLDFMKAIAKFSSAEKGPIAARDFLSAHGIPLIVEPHLPYTYLDGAAILIFSERPIVGLSIRYDRLDNFWFTLMHELSHIALHSDQNETQFYDDLDLDAKDDPQEREADELAGEALIPRDAWLKSPASRLRSAGAAQHLAKQLGIHPAIVAGRMRHHWKTFRLLNNLVGNREVRCLFPNTKWPE